MVTRNSSCGPATRLERLRTQMHKLESLSLSDDGQTLEQFDAETEGLLIEVFGTASESVEAYKYATVGDADPLLDLAAPAQDGTSKHVTNKQLRHRRQILEGCVSFVVAATQEEARQSSPRRN